MYQLKPIEKFISVNSLNSALDNLHYPGFVFAGEMHNFWEAVFVETTSLITPTILAEAEGEFITRSGIDGIGAIPCS